VDRSWKHGAGKSPHLNTRIRPEVPRFPRLDIDLQGMCKNLVEKGELDGPLLLFNRTRKRCEDLQKLLSPGAIEIVDSIEAGASKADFIFICIADDTAVQASVEAILKVNVTGKLIVDCSTVHPETTEAVAKAVCSRGASFVAAPVFGAPAMADAGQLVCVLAGPKESIEKARPFFKGVIGRAEIDLSNQPYSKASTLKVLGNTFIFNMVEQLAEGFVVAEKCGLGTEPLLQFVEAIFPGPYVAYANRMLSGDYHTRQNPLFAVDLAKKDIRHAKSIAGSVGARLQNAETAETHLDLVREVRGASGDIAGIYGAARIEAGLNFENHD
jgi:3-hydroxyisobutyrate dehydrogenase-like beta-hydroxyacid dehydrogenase